MTTRTAERVIEPDETLKGKKVSLRLTTLNDCTERYLAWLQDSAVNQYLETRWTTQTLDSIREFVSAMLQSPDNYLFAIIENKSGEHIGNLKVGPINRHHQHADISYFIGERSAWGKGYASEAIQLATEFAFDRLPLHRIQAGLYQGNTGSARALEKAGYRFDGRFEKQLKGPNGWEDHVWYFKLNERSE